MVISSMGDTPPPGWASQTRQSDLTFNEAFTVATGTSTLTLTAPDGRTCVIVFNVIATFMQALVFSAQPTPTPVPPTPVPPTATPAPQVQAPQPTPTQPPPTPTPEPQVQAPGIVTTPASGSPPGASSSAAPGGDSGSGFPGLLILGGVPLLGLLLVGLFYIFYWRGRPGEYWIVPGSDLTIKPLSSWSLWGRSDLTRK
jgi:hypothetical protein